MNARPLLIVALSLSLVTPWSMAQRTLRDSQEDSFMEAAGDLQPDSPVKLNEVTVVLPPPEPALDAHSPAKIPDTDDAAQAGADTAGAHIPDSGDSAAPAAQDETPAENTAGDESSADPEPGLAVRVERLQTGAGVIDPAQVKLLAPFPAKLLAHPPEGWRIESPGDAPPFTREVELSPGKRITLNIRPHLLVVQTDSSDVFQVREPGFDAALGYRQNATIGAILSNSIRQLEDDSKHLGMALDQLQQLLVSLPQPEPEPAAQPATKTKR